jgi:hypothetical protein
VTPIPRAAVGQRHSKEEGFTGGPVAAIIDHPRSLSRIALRSIQATLLEVSQARRPGIAGVGKSFKVSALGNESDHASCIV